MIANLGIRGRACCLGMTIGAAVALAGCGGDGGGSDVDPTYTLGGSTTGLRGTVLLTTRDGDRLTITGDGSFTFPMRLRKGQDYSVTIAEDPDNQTCELLNAVGRMPAADVANLSLECTDDPVSIGGNIQGLNGELSLARDAHSDSEVFTSSGPFAFAEPVASGIAYDVTITGQPIDQLCSIANGFGVARAPVTSVLVSCVGADRRFELGGYLSGLTGAGLRIEAGPGNAVEPAPGATMFALPVGLANATAYDIGVAAQPAGQTCTISESTGSVDAADPYETSVSCVDNDTDPLSGTYVTSGPRPGSRAYVTFFPDGVYLYVSIEDALDCGALGSYETYGIEYGAYQYDSTTHAFASTGEPRDNNGPCGFWDEDYMARKLDGSLSVAGSGATTVLTLTPSAGGAPIIWVPVPNVDGGIVGSWAAPYQKNVAVFLPTGDSRLHYLMTETQVDFFPLQTGITIGLEYGCALPGAMSGGSLQVDLSDSCDVPALRAPGARDLNGRSGLSPLHTMSSFTVAGDTMTLNGVTYRRIQPQ